MQRHSEPPRDHLNDDQVIALLTDTNVEVDFGAEVLHPNLTLNTEYGDQGDISDHLLGGTIGWSLHADIHRHIQVQMSVELTWGLDLIRPYMTITGDDATARWNLGVFALTTPERRIGETPEVWECEGYDRLFLLNRQVGANYTISAGTNYRTALIAVFAAAGLTGTVIESSSLSNTLPVTRTWQLVASDKSDPDQTDTPVTWLRIVNDLLRAINFRGVWCDESGLFRCGPYMSPTIRGPEFTFDVDDLRTIVGEDRALIEDVWATPNRWVFRQTNRDSLAPTPTEGDGIYTVENAADGPTSIAGRGLVWTSVVDYEAANQAKLMKLGDRHIANDTRVTSVLSVTTGPFPGASHADIYQYEDAAIGSRRVHAVEWEMPLDGADMTWQWERVN